MGGGMEADLSHGAVAAMWRSAEKGFAATAAAAAPVLQVAAVPGTDRVVLTDGVHSQPAVLGAAMSRLLRGSRPAIRAGTVVRVLDYLCDAVRDGRRTIIVIQLEILQVECPLIGSFKLYESRKSGSFVARSTAFGTQWPSVASGTERTTANSLPHGGSRSDNGSMQLSSIARWAAEPAIFKTVSHIKDDNLGYSETPDLIIVKASVSYVNTKRFCYPACPLLNVVKRRQCNKVVTREADGTWYCKGCDKIFENCDYRYSACIRIQDATGMAYAYVFEEAGNDIFCRTAKELYSMKCEKQDYPQFADVVQGVLLNEYVLKLKVKLGTYYDGRKRCVFPHKDETQKDNSPLLACTIVKAEKVNAPWMARFRTSSCSGGSTSQGARQTSARRVTFQL